MSTAGRAWVLVVDDDAMNRMMLFRLLEHEGHNATVADNGREALEILRAEPFDLVLLDILMPGMDGYQVLEAIKADPGLRHIPVIMISAVEDTESVVRCLELGADDYLPKPFNPLLLRVRIDASLARKRLLDRETGYREQISELQQREARLRAEVSQLRGLLPGAGREPGGGDAGIPSASARSDRPSTPSFS